MAEHQKILDYIARCEDPKELRSLLANARNQAVKDVEDAAFLKLIAIVPEVRPGSLDHDFWRMVQAFEHIRSEENGRRTLLSRTRQKVRRVGVAQTLIDWATAKKVTVGFAMLMDLGLPELTGEAIVLRHSGAFSDEVVAAARARLAGAGADAEALAAPAM